MPVFRQVTIVGVGLLGASLGLALRKHGLATRIVGVGRPGSDSLTIARNRGAIDTGTDNIRDGTHESDLIVLCTPVCTFPALFEAMAGALSSDVIVTDVGSTKAQVMDWARQKIPNHVFIGSHPMAGSEKTGPAAARPDLFENATCLLVHGSDNKPQADAVERLWQAVGMKTRWMTPADHDQIVALISHLPHAAAFALAASVARHPESFIAAGGGFCDTTRIAGSDVTMWRDIFLTNRDAVVTAITTLETELAGLKTAIAAGDAHEIERRLTAARQAREAVMAAKVARGG